MTLGMMASFAHSTPKTSVSFLRLCVAASRIEKTVSPNQPIQRAASFSSKNLTPNWLANNGMYSIMASLTRHCLSSASWTIAGRSDCERSSMPITNYVRSEIIHRYFENYAPWLTSSSFEMMWRRTSGNSSFSIWRNIGRRWSIVLVVCQSVGQNYREDGILTLVYQE